MKRLPYMAPIRRTKSDIPIMVMGALHQSSWADLARRVGEKRGVLRSIASGKIAPTALVLRYFGLKQDGREYVWIPR